jgi:hypothetical protein
MHAKPRPQLIVMYLPQYHPIPEHWPLSRTPRRRIFL